MRIADRRACSSYGGRVWIEIGGHHDLGPEQQNTRFSRSRSRGGTCGRRWACGIYIGTSSHMDTGIFTY